MKFHYVQIPVSYHHKKVEDREVEGPILRGTPFIHHHKDMKPLKSVNSKVTTPFCCKDQN